MWPPPRNHRGTTRRPPSGADAPPPTAARPAAWSQPASALTACLRPRASAVGGSSLAPCGEPPASGPRAHRSRPHAGIGANLVSATFEKTCTLLVGASGAVFGFMGLFVADLMINFESISWPFLRVLIILLFVVFFVANAIIDSSPQRVSHASHIGGLVCGLFPSLLFLPNLRNKRLKALQRQINEGAGPAEGATTKCALAPPSPCHSYPCCVSINEQALRIRLSTSSRRQFSKHANVLCYVPLSSGLQCIELTWQACCCAAQIHTPSHSCWCVEPVLMSPGS